MLENSFHLYNLVYPDSSCCRDKISRAAGRRAVGSVFCSPFIKCTVTSKWRFHYRDSYVIGFYRDGTTSRHLPGLAKNSPTLTRTAPNHTTEPLAHIFGIVRLSPRAELIKFYRDKINSALLPGLSLARLTFFPRAVIINICYLINITTIYRDLAIARQNTCANKTSTKSAR